MKRPPLPAPTPSNAPFNPPKWTQAERDEARWQTIADAEAKAKKEARAFDSWAELYGKIEE